MFQEYLRITLFEGLIWINFDVLYFSYYINLLEYAKFLEFLDI